MLTEHKTLIENGNAWLIFLSNMLKFGTKQVHF